MSAPAPISGAGLRARRLRPDDLSACRALSDEAGWNQTDADWRILLAQAGTRGIERDGQLVATAAVFPYGGRIGWVCMVLVTASARRQGLATRLMRWAIGHAQRRGLVAGLDATPAGRTVYRQLGFRDLYPVTRLYRPDALLRPESAPGAVPVPGSGVQALRAADLDAVAAFDAARFGADRAALLAALRARMPQAAFLLRDGAGRVAGYGLARDGVSATQIGPIVARADDQALALAQALIGACAGPLLCDVPDRHAHLHALLARAGFAPQRTFMRMARGVDTPLDRPEAIFALTGPEFG